MLALSLFLRSYCYSPILPSKATSYKEWTAVLSALPLSHLDALSLPMRFCFHYFNKMALEKKLPLI